jgi:hypothetical protein
MLETIGYWCFAAGCALGLASLIWLGWGWGIVALILLFAGFLLLRESRRRDDGVDLTDVVDAVDLFD